MLAKLYDKYQKANGAYTPIEGKRTLSQIKAESRKMQDISTLRKLSAEYKLFRRVIPDGWEVCRVRTPRRAESKTAQYKVSGSKAFETTLKEICR